jgi:hypothetical protein
VSWLPAIVVVAMLAYAVRAALRAARVAEPGAWDRALEPPLEPGYAPLGLAHIRREVRHALAGAPAPTLDALLVDAVRARVRAARLDAADPRAVRRALGDEAVGVLEGRALGRAALERLLDRLEARW